MASTRNINTQENYKIQQLNFRQMQDYELYENSQSGAAYNPALPVLGFNPSHMSRNDLAHNPIEIESALFGINSTNLVNPQQPVIPESKTLPEKSFFKTPELIMPVPLAIEKNQRPFPI